MKTLIIIATYNEKDNIGPLLDDIFKYAPHVHVLVIDDNSPDKTYTIVEKLAQTLYEGRLFLLKRSGKLGLGTAYVAGFNWGLAKDYDVIMEMDADFSHHPRYIPDFLEAIIVNDLVLGSRYIEGGGVLNWSLSRKLISRGGSIYSRIILGLPFKDLTGGFKCFRREVLQSIKPESLKSNGYSFQIEGTYKAYNKGFRIKEIPIIFEDRRVGQSKMSSSIFIEALWMVIKMRLNK